jgi:hypothetical protein
MAAYNPGGSLVWSAALNVTAFQSGVQSMVAQMAFAQRAAAGLESSLKSIAAVAFAGLIIGIGGITAAIAISTKAAADWETQMLDVAQLADINIKTPGGLTEYNKLSRELLNAYADIPVQKTDLFTAVKPYAAANYTGDVLSNLTESTAKWHETSTVATDDISNMIIALAAINPQAVKAAGGIDAWADQVFSGMSRAANDSKITSQEIVSGITQSAGSLNKWNLQNQIPEQIALLTTMSQYGLDFGSWKTTLSSAVSGPGVTGPSTVTPEISKALQSAGINLPYESLTQSVSAKGKVSIKSEKIQYKGYDIAAAIMGYEDADAFMDAYEKDAPTLMLNTIDKIKSLGLPTLRENELYGIIFGERAARELPKMGGTSAVEYYADMVKKVTGAYEDGSLATELYEIKQSGLEAQWDKMTNRGDVVKTLLGDMFKGPVKERVESFSDSLRDTITWLEGITDKATLPDGTLNSWKAIGLVVDGLKQKFVDLGGIDLLKAGGITAGLLLIASNAGTVVAAVSKIPAAFAAITGLIAPVIAGMSASLLGLAARVSAAFAGISIAPLIATAGSVVSAIAGIAVVAGTVALGLAAIGYSLAPEKFTYFNQVASEALNGVATIARQVYDDISRGDWGAAGDHLKTGFTNAIAWIQQINWSQLGGEIVTMIGDGANAVIGTALNLAGWIYDNLNSWATGGGPRKLGESIGNFIEDGFKTISTTDWGQYIDDAINIASDWGALGWDIISQIGSGFLSGVAGAMTPAANSMIQIVTQAALEIYAAFAKTWNTIIVLAAGAATSIGNVFSGVGNTIAGYLQPAIDAVESLVSKIAGINLPVIGNIGGAVGEVNPIVKYYNQDSGSSISVEQYNLRKAEGKNYKGYDAVRMYDTNKTISQNTANIYDFIKSSDTFNKPLDVSTVTQPPTMSTTVREPEEFLYPGIPVIDTSGWNTNYAGYRTGGQGFVMDEMKSAGEGYSYLTTDLGEDITYLGDSFRMSNDELKKLLPYLIDYPTNKKELSQDIADSVMPIPKDIKSASDYSRQTNTEINNAAKQAFREYDEVQLRANQTTKDSALYSSTKTITAADFAAARSERTAQYNESSSRSIVDFATSSYNGISNGLTQTGFGFSTNVDNAGNGLYNNTTSGGTQFFTDTTSGGKNAETSLITGANAIDSVAQKLSNLEFRFGGGTGGDGEGGSTSSNYVDPIIDRLGSVVGSVLGGFLPSGLFKSSGTTTSTPDTMNVDNFEDLTCTGDRVMVNALKYTPPGGETTSYNPMDSVSIRSASNVEGTFTDMTCIGTSITIPGLKYTNPYGTTSYINPSEYISGGGVMDYQQTSAKKAGEITVNSARKSTEYQTSADNRYAEISAYVNANNLSSSQYIRDMEFVAAVESGNMWKNDLAFAGTAFAAPVNESTFNFNKMADESIEQAYDYLGTQMTVNDKEYIQAKERLEMDKAVIAELTGASNALSGAASSIESAGSNFVGSVSSAMGSFMSGSYGMGGGFGGTSKGGGGAWVGTLSTPGWSGPAISTWVQSNPSGTWGNSSFSWGAKGSLIDEPSRIIAGEKGRELLLPNYLTELFLKLAAMGFNNGSNGDGNIITIVNIDGEQVEKTVSKRQKSNLNLRGLKLH